MNDNEASLFDMEPEAQAQAAAVPTEVPIRDEQINAIRSAFESAGIEDQVARKEFIESVVIRDVGSLRDLRAIEGRRVLERLRGRDKSAPVNMGSSWDMREEDTWIDKL